MNNYQIAFAALLYVVNFAAYVYAKVSYYNCLEMVSAVLLIASTVTTFVFAIVYIFKLLGTL